MADFTISFFICNLWLCLPVLLLLAVKKCLKKQLSGRMPYHLWFLLLILLAVPFLPEHFTASAGFLRQLPSLPFLSFRNPDVLLPAASGAASGISENWLQDFTLSVSHQGIRTVAPMDLPFLGHRDVHPNRPAYESPDTSQSSDPVSASASK